MKTPEKLYNDWLENKGNTMHVFDFFKEIQTEAYNQAIDDAVENVTTTQINYFDGTEFQQLNCVDIWEEDSNVPCYLAIPDKQSILKLKK